MLVFQMHTEVNQRLQEVASYKRDKYYPQEIDMALNKAMFRLLEKGVDSKFQDAQINLSHVAALIKKNKVQEVINPATTDPVYEEGILNVYSPIPADLYWLINARVEVIRDPNNCDTAPDLGSTTIPEYTATVSFPASLGTGVPPYYSLVTVSSTTLGTLYTSPNDISAGFGSSNSSYVIINNIIETINRANSNVRVYWERYRDTYTKNSFIFVSALALGTVTVTLFRSDRTTIDNTSTGVATLTSYPGYNRALISSLTSKEVLLQSTKPQEQDLLYSSLKQNNFYKTRYIEPVLNQTQDYLIVYRDESFLVSRLYFDYIRKPRTISLALNQSCELADSTHPKVIDLAVEILRLDTKDQAYPNTVRDTELRTN